MPNPSVPAAATGLPNSTRRALLRGLAAAPLVALPAVPALAGAVEPDADLIASCNRGIAAEAAYNDAVSDDDDPALERIWEVYAEAREHAIDTPAAGLAGLKAKAMLLRRDLPMGTDNVTLYVDADGVERLTWALIDDILALGRV